jgi:cysteinyl-tRNA synthetase
VSLSLYNTLTKQKELFKPLDENHVTMYGCGPTVYNYIHIGNGRAFTTNDVLYRLLKALYPTVTYARNVTDIDDKIMTKAAEQGTTAEIIAEMYTKHFMQDMENLQCLVPTYQPKATEYIPQQIGMTETLIANGNAYEAEGHVLFSVPSYKDYGRLSGRNRDEQIAGARVEVAPYKRDPADFILWKPSTEDQPGWESPWGRGRPGWHLECSVMSTSLLGANFDIHMGGLDLIFPHHENEIAQSCCAHPGSTFANYWIHNGFLNMNNEKMSKSLGNFFTVHELLERHSGETIRLALLSAHYRQPLEFTDNLLDDTKKTLDRWYRVLEKAPDQEATEVTQEFMAALCDDLNTPRALAELHRLVGEINKSADAAELIGQFKACTALIGIVSQDVSSWFKGENDGEAVEIEGLIASRLAARQNKDFALADQIRDQLVGMGIVLDDGPNGTTWRRG